MSRRVQIWIAKNLDAGSHLMNIELTLRCKRIVRAHTNNQWGLRNLKDIPRISVDGQWKNGAV